MTTHILWRRSALLLVASMLTACGLGKANEIDVYLLAGQSNMVGVAHVSQLENLEEMVAEVANTRFVILDAGEQSFSGWKSWEPRVLKSGIETFGPELPLAYHLAQNSKREVALIKIAKGSTGLAQHWFTQPPTGGELYDHFVTNSLSAIRDLEAQGFSPKLKAFFWYQGERDANQTVAVAEGYAALLQKMIVQLRSDLNAPNLPVVLTRVNPHRLERWDHRHEVRSQIVSLAESLPLTTWVDVDDLPHPDKLHLDARGVSTVGERYYEALTKIMD